MTVSVKDIRVRITPENIHKYVSPPGIDSIFKPVEPENFIYDVRLQTSDLSPVPSERRTMEDLEKECEKFEILTERLRDSTLYIKSFDKSKVGFAFESDENNHALDSIDQVRSNAENINVEKDVPQDAKQIRWYDKSW